MLDATHAGLVAEFLDEPPTVAGVDRILLAVNGSGAKPGGRATAM